ncbi:hypothetical protein LZL87_011086 [Fusarium oxysporum]|nr:hypothetical protein LZL87_011086 [Fusarium oxysporum]
MQPPGVISPSQTEQDWFWAPATFPGCETPMDYADSHSTIMASVADIEIIRFDQSWAKDGHVLLRYTAQGSHYGEPYKGISKTGRHAQWSAAAIFEVEDGKIRGFTKDWDQKTMHMGTLPFHWLRDDANVGVDSAWMGTSSGER